MGVELTRACLRRGDVAPVGAIVTSADKDGVDLGEIAGLGTSLGASASLDADAVLAREDVDVVFYSGIGSSDYVAEVLERCVRAGKEAVTFSGLAHPATAIGPEAARELSALARERGKHILGIGLAPGFLTDVLPVVAASACVDWRSITARMVLPMDSWGALTLDAYGIGKPAGQHVETRDRLSFLESVGIVIDALNVDVDSVAESYEPIVSTRRRSGGAKVVEPGTVGGTRRSYKATTTAGRWVLVEIISIYMLDEEIDGLREEYVVEVDAERPSGARISASGGWSPDPYPATAACGLSALPGLLSLAPGLYNAAQVPFAVPDDDWMTLRPDRI